MKKMQSDQVKTLNNSNSVNNSVLSSITRKGGWLDQDLENLLEAIKNNTKNNKIKWTKVAKELGNNQTAKQCSEKFKNMFSSKEPWTVEEDNKLIELVLAYGTRWVRFINDFTSPRRSDNDLKNRYHKNLKKNLTQDQLDEIKKKSVRGKKRKNENPIQEEEPVKKKQNSLNKNDNMQNKEIEPQQKKVGKSPRKSFLSFPSDIKASQKSQNSTTFMLTELHPQNDVFSPSTDEISPMTEEITQSSSHSSRTPTPEKLSSDDTSDNLNQHYNENNQMLNQLFNTDIFTVENEADYKDIKF